MSVYEVSLRVWNYGLTKRVLFRLSQSASEPAKKFLMHFECTLLLPHGKDTGFRIRLVKEALKRADVGPVLLFTDQGVRFSTQDSRNARSVSFFFDRK
jgi:hypothetical protein